MSALTFDSSVSFRSCELRVTSSWYSDDENGNKCKAKTGILGQQRIECAEAKAQRIVGEEMARRGWREAELDFTFNCSLSKIGPTHKDKHESRQLVDRMEQR